MRALTKASKDYTPPAGTVLILSRALGAKTVLFAKDRRQTLFTEIDTQALHLTIEHILDGVSAGPNNGLPRADIEQLAEWALWPFEPLIDNNDHIALATDGKASQLPWGMLTRSNGSALVESHTVTRFLLPTDSARARPRTTLIVDALPPRLAKDYARLQGDDLDLVGKFGADANRTALQSLDWSMFGLLHFSSHGIGTFEPGAQQGLIDISGQTLLSRTDLQQIRLSRPLVFLASCESSVGEPIAGEQPLGLEWSFAASGAAAVISTLWKVDNVATGFFADAFYKRYLAGAPSSVAFTDAMREIRASRRWQHPYYWSGFILLQSEDTHIGPPQVIEGTLREAAVEVGDESFES